MSLEPPPRIVDKFVNIWRDWLYFFWEFVDSHTGGSSPTPPATGTSWNAHGNDAVGDATNALTISDGSFIVGGTGATGDLNGETDATGVAYLAWYQGFKILRVGTPWSGNGTYPASPWTAANLSSAIGSFTMGQSTSVESSNTIAIGPTNFANTTTGSSSLFGNGNKATASAVNLIGTLNNGFSQSSTAVGTGSEVAGLGFNLAVGNYVKANGFFTGMIGVGQPGSVIENTVWSSLGLGSYPSTTPDILLTNSRAGIRQLAPLSTLDVGGSVGYFSTDITSTDGSGLITDVHADLTFSGSTITSVSAFAAGFNVGDDIYLTSTAGGLNNGYFRLTNVASNVLTVDETFVSQGPAALAAIYQTENQTLLSEELTVIVDPDLVSYAGGAQGAQHIIKLPVISTVNRRMYHIRHYGALGNRTVLIRPDPAAPDLISISTSGANNFTPGAWLEIQRGESAQIVASLSKGAWVVI